jgi:hypothetical protein
MSVWQGVTNFKACTTHHNDDFYTYISSTHTVWHILEGRTARSILIKWPFRRFCALLLIFEAHPPVAVQWTDDRDSMLEYVVADGHRVASAASFWRHH